MNLSNLPDVLWGNKAKFRYLFIASLFLFFTFLGGREIWTQEYRWADIVSGMFYRNDFLHPYLNNHTYYDKPLLSYWLIAFFTRITGEFSEWALRIPSALSGLLAIWSLYRIGSTLKSKQLGLLSGWLLLTTFYFVFWARTSSADMLNLAGSLFAISWYLEKREHASFYDYVIFFLIVALTCLCKGLIGAVISLFAIFLDITLQNSWKKHLRLPLFLSLIPALIVYLAPFYASIYSEGNTYHQNGLYLVYRENILRYFHPFDHRDPIYIYFIYLPIYSLPWAIFLIPAIFNLKSRWQSMSLNTKWIILALFSLFLFLTLSGSRRSYYILPLVPFTILFIADWMLSSEFFIKHRVGLTNFVICSFISLFLFIDVLPAWYYSQFGVSKLAVSLKNEINKIKPWNQWNIVLLDVDPKLIFYLQLKPITQNFRIKDKNMSIKTVDDVRHVWPILENKLPNTIFISDKRYESILQPFFTRYRLVDVSKQSHSLFANTRMVRPIAFIPVG